MPTAATGTGTLGVAWLTHELEERNRIAQALLQGTQRAVATVRGDDDAFQRERRDRDAQRPVTAAGEGARPDVGDRSEELRARRLLLDPPVLGGAVEHGGMDLLVDPRHRREVRRADLGEPVDDACRIAPQNASVPPALSVAYCATRASECASGRNRYHRLAAAQVQLADVHRGRGQQAGVGDRAALRRPGLCNMCRRSSPRPPARPRTPSGVGRVDRDHGGPRAQRPEIGERPLGPGAREDRDVVAALDAETGEPAGDLVDRAAELGVGDRLPPGAVRALPSRHREPSRAMPATVPAPEGGRAGQRTWSVEVVMR